MRRRTVSLAALIAAVALGVLVASAAATSPPAGTPDLAKMAIQPSDLAPGAVASIGGYAKAPKNFTALYISRYNQATTTSGVALYGLETELLAGKTQGAAAGLFSLQRSLYHSKLGRKLLGKELVAELGKKGVSLKQVHFGHFGVLGSGTQSFVQPIVLNVKGVHAGADFVVVRVGSILSDVTMVLAKPAGALAVAKELGADVAAHIRAVLAGGGSTGATGPTSGTGATGATGATG